MTFLTGNCKVDGIYYKNLASYVVCTHGIGYVQACPSGTKNADISEFAQGSAYRLTAFCTVNLNDNGYSVYKHSKMKQKLTERASNKGKKTTTIEEKQGSMFPALQENLDSSDDFVSKHLVAYIYKKDLDKDASTKPPHNGYKYYLNPRKRDPIIEVGQKIYNPSDAKDQNSFGSPPNNGGVQYQYSHGTTRKDLRPTKRKSTYVSDTFLDTSSESIYDKQSQENAPIKKRVYVGGKPFEYTIFLHSTSYPGEEHHNEKQSPMQEYSTQGYSQSGKKYASKRNGRHTYEPFVPQGQRQSMEKKSYQTKRKSKTADYYPHAYGPHSAPSKNMPETMPYQKRSPYSEYSPKQYNSIKAPRRTTYQKPLVYGSNVQYQPNKSPGRTYKNLEDNTRSVRHTYRPRVQNGGHNRDFFPPRYDHKIPGQYRSNNEKYNTVFGKGYSYPPLTTPRPPKRQFYKPSPSQHSLSPVESDILKTFPGTTYRDYTKRALARPMGFKSNSYHKVGEAFPDLDPLIMERYRGHIGGQMGKTNGNGLQQSAPNNHNKPPNLRTPNRSWKNKPKAHHSNYSMNSNYQMNNMASRSNNNNRVSNPNSGYRQRNKASGRGYGYENGNSVFNYDNRNAKRHINKLPGGKRLGPNFNSIYSKPNKSKSYEQWRGKTRVNIDGSRNIRNQRMGPISIKNHKHARAEPQQSKPGPSNYGNRHGNGYNAFHRPKGNKKNAGNGQHEFNGRVSSVGLRHQKFRAKITSKPIKVNYAPPSEGKYIRQSGTGKNSYRKQKIQRSTARYFRNNGGRNAESPDGSIVEPLMDTHNQDGEMNSNSQDNEYSQEKAAGEGYNNESEREQALHPIETEMEKVETEKKLYTKKLYTKEMNELIEDMMKDFKEDTDKSSPIIHGINT